MELPGESSLSVDLTAAITESIPRVPLDFEIILRSRDANAFDCCGPSSDYSTISQHMQRAS